MNKSRSAAAVIVAALLLLPLLYVGSYLALVLPEEAIEWRWRGAPKVSGSYYTDDDFDLYPTHYRAAHEIAPRVFWPLEQLDRKLRPKAWKPFSLQREAAKMRQRQAWRS